MSATGDNELIVVVVDDDDDEEEDVVDVSGVVVVEVFTPSSAKESPMSVSTPSLVVIFNVTGLARTSSSTNLSSG